MGLSAASKIDLLIPLEMFVIEKQKFVTRSSRATIKWPIPRRQKPPMHLHRATNLTRPITTQRNKMDSSAIQTRQITTQRNKMDSSAIQNNFLHDLFIDWFQETELKRLLSFGSGLAWNGSFFLLDRNLSRLPPDRLGSLSNRNLI